MEVVKCGLCKEEIKYSQRCRVYIKTDEPRNAQRSSKRPHIGRYKVISTAPSTEHISFARRLKLLRKKQKIVGNHKNSSESSSTEQSTKICSQEEEPTSAQKPDILEKIGEESTNVQQVLPEQKDILANSTESESKQILSSEKESKKTEPQSAEGMSHPQFQSSFEDYIKPVVSKTPGKVKKTKSSDSNSDLEVNRKGSANTYKPTKTNTRGNPAKEFETYFWLELPKSKAVEPRKLAYQFENLVSEVKHMKLPSSEWKIKIMVHKQEMVSVSFNKKQTPEKSVSVNAKSSVCDIFINSKKLILMGSPIYIYSIKDLEVLLDIVNDVDPESSLVQYL
ncbi:hypothetical protein WA026_009606 [Henosepilachna vigintioctopunctata]|uniref:Uncharacterized protein n=1 Tax=Henosepilachna vigintioctopunctata TaxID=420089 RepID=A0AAW1U911_9CUCU